MQSLREGWQEEQEALQQKLRGAQEAEEKGAAALAQARMQVWT
jgi:hypothetical protein